MDSEKEIPKLIVQPPTTADARAKTETQAIASPQAQPNAHQETAVVFKLSDARAEEKKRAAKERRDFIRDRLKDKSASR